MSIYVRVGDEVIAVQGQRSEDGRHAACPLPIEVVVDQARAALDRQAIAGKVGAAPTRVIGSVHSATTRSAPTYAQIDPGDLTELTGALARGRLTPDGFSAEPAVTVDAEQFDPFAELAKWRRWAARLLKDDGFQDDERRRKKIAAVLEAPSAMPADIVPRDAGDPVVEVCARVAHEVYRAGFGDPTMPEWDLAPEHERSVARESASAVLSGTTPEEWHVRWTGKLLDEGWEYGPVKDEANKRHPNLVVYSSLPAEQRLLDQVFAAAVVATAQALEAYEEAFAVPVLRVAGDISSEQFASFRREWERQVAGSNAWKTPVLNSEDVRVIPPRRPPNPYTRSGMLAFIDSQVDAMLRAPVIWGSNKEVELQVLLLAEVRVFVSVGQSGVDGVIRMFERFVSDKLGLAHATNQPLADQLDDLGRSAEFVGIMSEFVGSLRKTLEQPVSGGLGDDRP